MNKILKKTDELLETDLTKKSKLATPISNGGLLFHPPGAITGSAQGGISQHHFYLLPPKEGSYLLPSSNLSFSSCS